MSQFELKTWLHLQGGYGWFKYEENMCSIAMAQKQTRGGLGFEDKPGYG